MTLFTSFLSKLPVKMNFFANRRKNFKHKRRLLAWVSGAFLLGLFIIFGPFLWANLAAESVSSFAVPQKTLQIQFDLVHPRYAIFEKHEDFSSKVVFVELSRKWLVLWEATKVSEFSFAVPEDVTNEQKQDLQNQNLDALHEAVKNGRLTPQTQYNGNNLDELTRSILTERTKTQQPGAEKFSIQDISQTHTATVTNGLIFPENNVLINGNLEPLLKNSHSLVFESRFDEAKYLYFSPFEVFSSLQNIEGSGMDGYGTVQFFGQVKRFSVTDKTVEVLYTFDRKAPVSIQANTQYVVASLYSGEMVVMDTKGAVLFKPEIPFLHEGEDESEEEHLHEDTATDVIDIGSTTAVIRQIKDGQQSYFRLNLTSGEVTEL